MSRLFRHALVVTAASMATGLLVGPVAAYADDATTNLSAEQMRAALKVAVTPSQAAAKDGWRATIKTTIGSIAGNHVVAVEPVGGVAFEQYTLGPLKGTDY